MIYCLDSCVKFISENAYIQVAINGCHFVAMVSFRSNHPIVSSNTSHKKKNSGATVSLGTGPSSAQDGTYYMFIETSSPRSQDCAPGGPK